MSTDGIGRLVGWLASCVLLICLAGCGGDEPEPELDISGGDSSAASPGGLDQGSESAPPAGVPEVRPAPEQGDEMEDEYGAWALELPGKNPARLVAQGIVDYMDVRTAAFHTGEVDLTKLSSVAMGEALTQVQGAVLDLRERKLHTVGDAWLKVEDQDVKVKGGRATVSDACLLNATVDVNEQNVAQESPADAYSMGATAVRVAPDTWLISAVSFEETATC